VLSEGPDLLPPTMSDHSARRHAQRELQIPRKSASEERSDVLSFTKCVAKQSLILGDMVKQTFAAGIKEMVASLLFYNFVASLGAFGQSFEMKLMPDSIKATCVSRTF
jgi:hypothetical protein